MGLHQVWPACFPARPTADYGEQVCSETTGFKWWLRVNHSSGFAAIDPNKRWLTVLVLQDQVQSKVLLRVDHPEVSGEGQVKNQPALIWSLNVLTVQQQQLGFTKKRIIKYNHLAYKGQLL